MPQMRVWRRVGDNDLQLLGMHSALVSLFVLNEDDVLGEFVSGQFEGLLLTYQQLAVVLKQ